MTNQYLCEPGTGLSRIAEDRGRDSTQVVRPQLELIRELYFGKGKRWPDAVYPRVIKVPFAAGYVLGMTGRLMQEKGIKLSDRDIVMSVMDIDTMYRINGMDLQIAVHYPMQQDIFRFGLAVGDAELGMIAAEFAKGIRVNYTMLAHTLNLFLKYDDDETLALNLKILSDMLNLGEHDYEGLVERWNSSKENFLWRLDDPNL